MLGNVRLLPEHWAEGDGRVAVAAGLVLGDAHRSLASVVFIISKGYLEPIKYL